LTPPDWDDTLVIAHHEISIYPEKTAIFPETLGKIVSYLSRGTDAGIGEE
jgi:hypothetical protein